MNVFTYYEPTPLLGQEYLLACWQDSWRAKGWNPCVLGADDARRHPLFQAYNKAIKSFPTVNAREYEEACWRRWLAYSVASDEHVESIVATDYDVINRDLICGPGVRPAVLGRTLGLHENPTAACVGSKRSFDAFVMLALRSAERGIVRVDGRMHVSDMTLSHAVPELWDWKLITEEWWADAAAPLLHVSAHAVERAGTSKSEVMARWRTQEV